MAAFLTAVCGGMAQAKDFGVYGKLFPITEPDFLEQILSRFRTMEGNGEWDAMKGEMQERTREYIERPTASGFLSPAEEYRAFRFDPSISVDRDLADDNGQVFAAAGSTVNPLAYSSFNKRIVVIDGDKQDQVEYALSKGNELDTLIVLASGAPLDLMRSHGRRFWFDQQGVIVKRFGLERLPSVITRDDPFMLIEEIPTGEGGQ
jgi:conjugal transfer pilus assembly protein TraW